MKAEMKRQRFSVVEIGHIYLNWGLCVPSCLSGCKGLLDEGLNAIVFLLVQKGENVRLEDLGICELHLGVRMKVFEKQPL